MNRSYGIEIHFLSRQCDACNLDSYLQTGFYFDSKIVDSSFSPIRVEIQIFIWNKF